MEDGVDYVPTPLLTGAEIAELTGIEPGPELGSLVERLLCAQVCGDIRSRNGAIRLLHRSRRLQQPASPGA
jgi:hypothetical protein